MDGGFPAEIVSTASDVTEVWVPQLFVTFVIFIIAVVFINISALWKSRRDRYQNLGIDLLQVLIVVFAILITARILDLTTRFIASLGVIAILINQGVAPSIRNLFASFKLRFSLAFPTGAVVSFPPLHTLPPSRVIACTSSAVILQRVDSDDGDDDTNNNNKEPVYYRIPAAIAAETPAEVHGLPPGHAL